MMPRLLFMLPDARHCLMPAPLILSAALYDARDMALLRAVIRDMLRSDDV